jgi:hypothetical protein
MAIAENPAHTAVLQRPVIVLGAARSGTSFLQRCLSNSPELATLVEPRLVWKYGNDTLSDWLEPHHAREEVIRYIRRTFGEFVIRENRERLLEKLPSNALRPGFVHRVFPDALFVNIIRHPVDSVLSTRSYWLQSAHGTTRIAQGRIAQRLKEIEIRRLPYYAKEIVRRLSPRWFRGVVGQNVWGPRLPGIEQMTRQLDLLDICCLQWRTCVERSVSYGRTLPKEQYLRLHIEDLDPAMIRCIAEFCQLRDPSEPVTMFESQYVPLLSAKRKVNADPETVNRIRAWCEPTTQWLGRYTDW